MKFFLFFLMLAALAAACPPLFNDFAFRGNDIHTTQDLVRDLFDSHPQTEWSEIVTLVCNSILLAIRDVNSFGYSQKRYLVYHS
jgi:hypothetical protein